MKSKWRLRWIGVGCIWVVVLGLTWWNLARIDDVVAARRANEALRKEISFQRHNAQRLEQVAARHDNLFMAVESVDLGMVTVRYRLRALAAAFNLEDLSIQAEMSKEGEQIDCSLSLRGAFENTVGFLTSLNQYNYLTPRQTLIAVANGHEVRLELRFLVHYRIAAPPTAPMDPSPTVTAQPPESEGRPL